MKKNTNTLFIGTLILLTVFCFTGQVRAETETDVFGIEIGMSKEKAHEKLEKIGKLEKNESKNQEVWVVNEDPRFSYLIVAFNKEYTEVRFVTAKARENGERIRYSDVLDIKKARQAGTSGNNNYILEIPADGDKKGYKVIARGADSEYLTYFSIEQLSY